MKQIYLIRHGEKTDYHGLSPYGREQVIELGKRLENRLMQGASYCMVSSPSQRAVETATILRPLIERKAKTNVLVQTENAFGELESFASGYENNIKKGKEKVPFIEKYLANKEIVLITSHLMVISSTGLGMAIHYEIPYSDTFTPRILEPDNEDLINDAMKENKCKENEAKKWLVKKYPEIFCLPPSIPEASALIFDLESRTVEMISCGLRKLGGEVNN